MKPLSTNGLVVSNFPVSPYEAVHERMAEKFGQHASYEHFAGAWNAIAYRFKAAHEHGDSFITLFADYGASPPPEQRYLQERALFDFYSSAFSVFEASFYGLYALGSCVSPTDFILVTPRDQQKVSPATTRDAYEKAFPGDPILPAFNNLFADSEYQKMRESRNILTHRSAPGRRMFVSIGEEGSPPAEWKLDGAVFDGRLATTGQAALTRLITDVLTAGSAFALIRI